jgi:hypothetical protein
MKPPTDRKVNKYPFMMTTLVVEWVMGVLLVDCGEPWTVEDKRISACPQ